MNNTQSTSNVAMEELLSSIALFNGDEPSGEDFAAFANKVGEFALTFGDLHELLASHEVLLDATKKDGARHLKTGTLITTAMFDPEFKLLEKIRDINRIDEAGSTLLLYSCGISDPRLVEKILEMGGDTMLAGKPDGDHPRGHDPIQTARETLNGSGETRAACVGLLRRAEISLSVYVDGFRPNPPHLWMIPGSR